MPATPPARRAGSQNPDGSYAKKQLRSRIPLLRFSHGARFKKARRLVTPHAGKRLLDFGCGDGTFLAAVSDLFPRPCGADQDANQLAHCRILLPEGEFMEPGRVAGPFDVITCMEVFEHCLAEERHRLLDAFRGWLAQTGTLIISVPIEVGPSLAVKESVRTLAGLLGQNDYRHKEKYHWKELLTQFTARAETKITRPIWKAGPTESPRPYHGHKGFNWMAFQKEIEQRFRVQSVEFSPVPALGKWLNSQAWFVCRPR